ncbi:diacylglycerol kinase-like protein [Trypanosoma grayi]|uniref:diacylglycerol kinase-like protein n=1 Tax=Trypanosoma grayi TaxID=71804 RepID=UPI0004F4AB5A|nr:diacylglycerol kinase-like protein [Trypanosoma grayi]KEG11311.1 diacylglycerol kinase-like protein [Trypanosoma grayi]
MLVDEHSIPVDEDVGHVIVALINGNSGERKAASFVRKQLIAHIGDDKVFHLFPVKRPAVEDAKAFIMRHKPAVVIVAGGDGTVSLVLDILDGLRDVGAIPCASAAVAVLPMGTGNDLSRTLGFGGGYVKPLREPDAKFQRLLDRIKRAKKLKMDRWKLVVQKYPVSLSNGWNDDFSKKSIGDADAPSHTMMNYFSIGFDASIISQFSAFRDEHPTLCSQRAVNKFWYGCFGCGSMCTADTLPRGKMRLQVDGMDVEIPPDAKALVVTNVTSYAGGAVLWEDSRGVFAKPSVGDGMLEVCVLYGALHIAGVHAGIRKAMKVAQGRQLRIMAPAGFAMQYDGEPMNRIASISEMIDVRITFQATTLVMVNEDKVKHSGVTQS